MTIKTMRQRKKRFASWSFVFFLLFVCGDLPVVAGVNDALTNASDVLVLPAKEASLGVPIFVKGVVTFRPNWFRRRCLCGAYQQPATRPRRCGGSVRYQSSGRICPHHHKATLEKTRHRTAAGSQAGYHRTVNVWSRRQPAHRDFRHRENRAIEWEPDWN